MIKALIEPMGFRFVPACQLSMVWSENLGDGESHLFKSLVKPDVMPLPPANVVTYLVAYHLCEDYAD